MVEIDSEQQQRELALKQEREANQVLLREYIRSKGGKIPFDDFAWFNSYSDNGYYQRRVAIGIGQDFSTYASNPLLAQAYVGYAETQLRQKGSTFVELAGGEGTFKQNALRFLSENGINTRYVSIDLSSLLIGKQQAVEPNVVQASALKMPIASNSINGVVAANELPDALPLKVTAVRTAVANGLRRQVALEELYYVLLPNGEISAEWGDASPLAKSGLAVIEAAWAERGIFFDNFRDGQEIVFAPGVIELIPELIRIMHSGVIILTDYGGHIDEVFNNNNRLIQPTSKLFERMGVRQYPSKRSVPLKDLPSRVFENDLTSDVDFTFLIYLAKQLGATCKLYEQGEFCGRFNPDELFESVKGNPDDKRSDWFKSNNPIIAGDGWKALVISVVKPEAEPPLPTPRSRLLRSLLGKS